MLLQDKPGIWIPLTDDELARAKALREEIAHLAQRAPGEERHLDRLARLSLLIGTAAVGAVVAETEGPQAEKKWRAQNGNERLGAGDILIRVFRDAWRQWRQDKARAQAVMQGKVIALNAQSNARKPW
jgi:hypothetical protein